MGKVDKELIHRQIVFNPHDLLQSQLLEHCKRYSNFSGYIKRLIERDMHEQAGRLVQPLPKPTEDLFSSDFNIDLVI